MYAESVDRRYSAAARTPEQGLCCPVPLNPAQLAAIPEEVLQRDYGCGDPTPHLRPGETVLDLGSGSGKICFVAAQVVGPAGRVIGVDINPEMLSLACRSAPVVAERLGYSNVEFRRGRIEDLKLDWSLLEQHLREHPVTGEAGVRRIEDEMARLRATAPLVKDASVDVVVSNCVLNLVSPAAKKQMFSEIHRVLKRGGRAVISDIVSDEEVPAALQQDPELWSGCYSGAMREDRFLDAFAEAGLYGVTILERSDAPWRIIDGIEFRSMTVAAYKGKEGPCWDHLQSVIYTGPFKRVEDDDGHVLERGVRVAVCEKTFGIYGREPYRQHFRLVEPAAPLSPDQVRPFPCNGGMIVRDPREAKQGAPRITTEAAECCPGKTC